MKRYASMPPGIDAPAEGRVHIPHMHMGERGRNGIKESVEGVAAQKDRI